MRPRLGLTCSTTRTSKRSARTSGVPPSTPMTPAQCRMSSPTRSSRARRAMRSSAACPCDRRGLHGYSSLVTPTATTDQKSRQPMRAASTPTLNRSGSAAVRPTRAVCDVRLERAALEPCAPLVELAALKGGTVAQLSRHERGDQEHKPRNGRPKLPFHAVPLFDRRVLRSSPLAPGSHSPMVGPVDGSRAPGARHRLPPSEAEPLGLLRRCGITEARSGPVFSFATRP
jgi:hypothetical protein